MLSPEILNYPVVVQKWEESERDWGVKPDGYSLHLNDEDRQKHINDYWDSMPNKPIPDEYSRPRGTPYIAKVSLETFVTISESKNGLRFISNNYPGSGGLDGWVPNKI